MLPVMMGSRLILQRKGLRFCYPAIWHPESLAPASPSFLLCCTPGQKKKKKGHQGKAPGTSPDHTVSCWLDSLSLLCFGPLFYFKTSPHNLPHDGNGPQGKSLLPLPCPTLVLLCFFFCSWSFPPPIFWIFFVCFWMALSPHVGLVARVTYACSSNPSPIPWSWCPCLHYEGKGCHSNATKPRWQFCSWAHWSNSQRIKPILFPWSHCGLQRPQTLSLFTSEIFLIVAPSQWCPLSSSVPSYLPSLQGSSQEPLPLWTQVLQYDSSSHSSHLSVIFISLHFCSEHT